MNPALKDKNVVIGVTGGIACYKVLDLIKELRRLKANVYAILTKNSLNLIDKSEFEEATGNKVQTELFEPDINYKDYIRKIRKSSISRWLMLLIYFLSVLLLLTS